MDLKPVNSINNDGNTIRVSDGNSPIRLIFKDVKGEVINLYDKIDYFYLTKDDEKFYSVTDISYDGDEVIIRLPKLRKGKYKAEIRDKDGSIYPANEDLYILLRRSFEDDKDIYYFGHREDILNSVEPMVIQHIEKNPNKFKGERGQQGFPGRDGLRGQDGQDGKDGKDGDQGIQGNKGDKGEQGIQGIQGIKGDKGDKGDKGTDGVITPEQYALIHNKIDKGDVKTNDLSPQLLELINNSDGTPFEILSIPRDRSVSEEKTTFINLSTNLLIESTLSKNKVINPNNGELINGNRHTSDFIKVEPSSYITTSFGEGYATYDSGKNFISFGSVAGSENGVTKLLNGITHYIRVEIYPVGLGIARINIGENLLPYERGYKRLSEDIEINYEIGRGEVKNENIAENSISFNKTTFIETSSNLIIKDELIPNSTIDATSGEMISNSNHDVTPRLKVEPSTNYSMKGVGRFAEYDSEGNFIRSTGFSGDDLFIGVVRTTATNAHTAVLVVRKDLANEAQANEGENLLPYVEGHKPRLSEEIEVVGVGNGNEDKKIDVKNDDYFVTDSLTENYYKQTEILPGRDRAKDSSTSNEVFDVFPSDHPDYITKTQLATSVNGKPIYLLDFNPDIVGEPNPETIFPEIFIVCGIHGTERVPPEIAYRTLDQIYNHWEGNKVLEHLRWNVRIKLIPLLNPDGWDNDTRQNANGIDLNRQFPDDWVLGTEGSSTYGGSAPLTEPESIAVNKILEENHNFIYVCDFHNFSSGDYNFIWNAGGTVFNNNLAKTLISKTRREWIKEYDWYNDGDEGVRGYSSWTPGGSIARRASALGMQSSTFEFTMGHDLDPSGENYSSNIMTLGTEAFINWLYLNAKNNIQIINRNRK